jgi:prepilin-type N-terminal cleavage/methylation domain-containing protein
MSSGAIVSRSLQRLTRSPVKRGFTLTEILIVIVMISLLSLVAIPRFAMANAKRHMESSRMRIAAGLATARQAAIQKGQPVHFIIANNLVRVVVVVGSDSTNLMSPAPLDTLYKVSASPDTIDFSSRGFAVLDGQTVIRLTRAGVSDDSVVITKTGMVQR